MIMSELKKRGIQKIKKEIAFYDLSYYHGSLDFPCDFCGKNSYKNFHIKKDNALIVVCEDCLKEAKKIFEEYDKK